MPASRAAADRARASAGAGRVLGDQRPVEVAREDVDLAREAVGRFSSAAGLDDVRGHVGDLLLAELAFERRHSAAAGHDLLVGGREVTARLVEVRADASRSCLRR